MGSLFGSYLSQKNDVWLVDIDQEKVDKINKDGVIIKENKGEKKFFPKAVTDTSDLEKMDLVIVFVKAMYTRDALTKNKNLIGNDTYVMTLQNGAGHEEKILDFVEKENIIIGVTEHNSSIVEIGKIHHGGGGKTNIGKLTKNLDDLQSISKTLIECGFETEIADNIKKQIWRKLFVNISASVLTSVLQVKLGYILDNKHAWNLAESLVKEAVTVAKAEGIYFDLRDVLLDLKDLLDNARDGYTSIYADLKAGVRTEVDTINGTVIKKAEKFGVDVPSHKFVVELVHALEGKSNS